MSLYLWTGRMSFAGEEVRQCFLNTFISTYAKGFVLPDIGDKNLLSINLEKKNMSYIIKCQG